MKYESIRKYLRRWCKAEGLVFVEHGECGICRTCVGVLDADIGAYPDYGNYDENGYPDGSLPFIPKNAYHKYPCLAVLYYDRLAKIFRYRRYKKEHSHWASLKQLYQWIKWLEKHGYHYKKWEEDVYEETHYNQDGEWVTKKECVGKRWRGAVAV